MNVQASKLNKSNNVFPALGCVHIDCSNPLAEYWFARSDEKENKRVDTEEEEKQNSCSSRIKAHRTMFVCINAWQIKMSDSILIVDEVHMFIIKSITN